MNILKIKRALAELVWTGALLFAAASVFLRPGAAAGGVLRGLSVCYETVIPALFPFLVLSRLLLESRAASALGLLLRPYTRLLGLHSTKAPAAMLCGVLGGFAGGAKAVDVLYRTGELTAAEAALLLVCTIGSGPGLVVSSVGALMLGSAGAGWLLLGAQLGASLVCGLAAALFVRLRKRGSMAGRFRAAVACAAQTGKGMPAGRCSVTQKTQPDAVPSQTGFVPAVRDSVNAIVMLCGYVTLFSFFAAIAVPTGADASVRFWATLPLEVTSACRAACETASAWRTQLCCAALSVMGASVFLQVRALLAPRIPLLPLLLSRLLHCRLRRRCSGFWAKLFPGGVVRAGALRRQPSSGCAHAAGCVADIRHGRAMPAAPYPCPGIYAAAEKGHNQCRPHKCALRAAGRPSSRKGIHSHKLCKNRCSAGISPGLCREYCSHVVRAADGSSRCTRRGAVPLTTAVPFL